MNAQTVSVPRLAYSLNEAALATGLSIATLNRMIGRGELRRVKAGKRSLIPAADLAALCGAKGSGREANGIGDR